MRLARLLLLGALNWSVQWYDAERGASLEELTDAAMRLFCRSRLDLNPLRQASARTSGANLAIHLAGAGKMVGPGYVAQLASPVGFMR